MSGKFWTGIVLAAAGFALALSPVVSASSAGAPSLSPASPVRAAQGAGVVAGVVVHGRPWAGNPRG